ncbi:MAG TPA: hypothetical protein EYP90_06870, partial [Chromatiaceae bacterium]|nr:hypothetical protein [Chromatiaceae bacterium]
MADIRDARIRKKIYHFDVKRRYQHVIHYQVHEKSPVEKIRESIKGMFKPKPKEEEKPKKTTEAPPPSGFNFKILGAAVIVALLIIGLGWMYVSTSLKQFQPGVFEPQLERPFMENWI